MGPPGTGEITDSARTILGTDEEHATTLIVYSGLVIIDRASYNWPLSYAGVTPATQCDIIAIFLRIHTYPSTYHSCIFIL